MPDFLDISKRLDSAWLQLAGTELQFRPDNDFKSEDAAELCASIPIHLVRENVTGGIALSMSPALATALAASMFGEPAESVDEEMRSDVCAELSNILCSCIVPLFGEHEEVEQGVPANIGHAEFLNIYERNKIRCIFQASAPEGCINLLVVDSFSPAVRSTPSPEPVLPTVEEKTSMKFLIVDDSRAIQTIVRRAVEKTGLANLEIKTASNGAEALNATESWLPDMVITDWHMPGMSGIDLIKELKRKHAGLKVGMVTTESSTKNLDEARHVGAAFVLGKPFADDALVHAILNVLEGVPPVMADNDSSMHSCDQAKLTEFLSKATGVSVALTPSPSRSLESIHPPWAIGLYASAGKNDVRGFCLFDQAAILLLGGPRMRLQHPVLLAALNKGEVSHEAYEKAGELMQSGANIIFHTSDGSQVQLTRRQLIPSPPEKLIQIMNKSPRRIDYSVTHSGLPVGHITIITR